MKYILSGCTGHLGLNLVKYLLSAGKSVKAIALPGENTEKLSEHGAEVVYGDVTDRDFVFSQVEQGCVFFHLAGIIDITSGNKDKVYLVNVKGTENVADACLAKGARLVYTSSVHVIPPAKKGKVMCEPVSFSPDKVVGDYAKSKTIATKYVFEKCREGLDAVVLYPSGIIGPLDDKVSSLGQLVLDIANRKIRTRVTGGYNFVDVRDVACGVARRRKGQVGRRLYFKRQRGDNRRNFQNRKRVLKTHGLRAHACDGICKNFLLDCGSVLQSAGFKTVVYQIFPVYHYQQPQFQQSKSRD